LNEQGCYTKDGDDRVDEHRVHAREERTRPLAVWIISSTEIEGIDQYRNDGNEQERDPDG
jgi:hypothetical protein